MNYPLSIPIDERRPAQALWSRLAPSVAIQLATHVATVSIGLASTAILSRYLGVEGFGRFSYLYAFYYFFLALNDFGVNTIVVRELAQNRSRAGELLGSMLIYKMGLSALSVAIAWLIIFSAGFERQLAGALLLFAAILPLHSLQIAGALFQVLPDFKTPAILGIVTRLAGLGLVLGAVALKGGLMTIVAIQVVTELLFGAGLVLAARRRVHIQLRFDRQIWSQILRASLPLGLAGIAVAFINRIDFLMLERMAGIRDVGLYSAAYKITSLLEAFPLLVMTVAYPVLARLAKENAGELRGFYRRTSLILAAFGVAVGAACTLLAARFLPLLFGARFDGAVPTLQVLVWASVCVFASLTAGNLLIAAGRERISLVVSVAGVAVNISLNLVLIPRYGTMGAAIATVAAFIVIAGSTLLAAEVVLRQLGRSGT
jgi:O-antigen/teichoic acid export membrane protein